MTTLFEEDGGSGMHKKKDGLLFSLSVETVLMDDYKKMRNAQLGGADGRLPTIAEP